MVDPGAITQTQPHNTITGARWYDFHVQLSWL